MDGIRQQLFIEYMYYLNETDRFYATKARYAKHVLDFLESASSVDRRGFMAFKREHSLEMANDYSCGTAICDFLNFCGKGYNRKKKSKVKTLEKLSVVSDKNKEQLNGFMTWLDENFDYSPHTLNMYYFSLKKFFEYANEVNMSNAKMYVSTLEEQALSPQTIRLRILALEKFAKWKKKPFELKRPKQQRKLETNNIPTEEEYNRLLEYLKTKKNKDYYFFIKVLGTTGARLSEFMQFTWEDIISGEVTLKGKGNKYRRFFFQGQLLKEAKAYVKETGKTGTLAMGKYGKITSRGLSSNMKAWGKSCGIPLEKMHPHAFRHFFAKMFLKKNHDIVLLADLLGHANMDTTRIYLQKSYEEQKASFTRSVSW